MVNNKLEILNNIAYFAKCKKAAIKQMSVFLIPLDDEHSALMNISYNAYFTYWIGLVDYLISISFMEKKDIINLVESEDNYYYIRNLRNSVVHRAENLANKRTVIENTNVFVPFSPVNITDQSKGKKYQPFSKYLIDIVIICERINSLCLSIINQHDLTNYSDDTKEEFVNTLINNQYLAPELKRNELYEFSWQYYFNNKDEMKQDNVKRILSYFDTEHLINMIIKKETIS